MSSLMVAAVAALVAVAAVLRAGAASLVRTPRADALHDAAEERKGASIVARLLEQQQVIVPAVNIVHSALLVTAGVMGAYGMARTADPATGAPALASLAVLVILLMVAGDLLPRTIGRSRPRRLAYRLAPFLAVAIRMGARAAEIIGDDQEPATDGHGGEDEENEEIELISSVLEFSETIVREVMVPRTDIVAVEADANLDRVVRLLGEHGYSRIPVIGESLDDVRGVVIVKDLLTKLAAGERPRSVADVMRPVEFVPETKRAADLLREMQASKSHLAIVVDEYGGTAGLVTIEDLLEELVGEIVDEYDEDENWIQEQADGSWLVDARLSVAELAEVVQCDLPDEEWDTVGGLVLGLAGRVPREGEGFQVDGVILTPTRVQGRRVVEVSVARMPTAREREA